MKKLILCSAAILFVFGSCKKSGSSTTPFPFGHGGYVIGNISGLFDITLPRNTDTTIAMPIKVSIFIGGNYTPTVTVSIGTPLPADVAGVNPEVRSLQTLYGSSGTTYVTDTAAFQIHAIDTGIFLIHVFASSNGEVSDSFKITVR